MTIAPMHWGAEALWQQLEPLLPGLSVEVVLQTASTNSALLERARATADTDAAAVRRSIESTAFGRRAADVQPCLLVAEQQTGGRGRQGRGWHAERGASLTFSLSLPLRAADWSGLSLAVGVALCEALAGFAPPADANAAASTPKLGLKWPNDLWILDAPGVGRKLGGILIETVSAGAQRLGVIGIGINVAPQAAAGAVASATYASLHELDPLATPPAVLARIALPLVQALRLFEREGFAAFAARYAALDILAGQRVRLAHADFAEGEARGVTAQGALQVMTADGLRALSSGEVSVRLEQPPAPA